MFALVDVEVDEFRRDTDGVEDGFLDGLRLAKHRDDEAVVIFVAFVVDETNALTPFKRCDDALDLLLVASFTKIGDAFNDLFHFCHAGFPFASFVLYVIMTVLEFSVVLCAKLAESIVCLLLSPQHAFNQRVVGDVGKCQSVGSVHHAIVFHHRLNRVFVARP